MPVHGFSGRSVVLVDGCRTPFARSQTDFTDLMAYELGAMAVSGLLRRTGIDPARVDRLILGTVLSEPRTSNVAREVALVAGLPVSCAASTVTAACVSANVAIAQGAEAIASGAADVVIAGGAETLSDVPIRFRRPMRKRLLAGRKSRGLAGALGFLRGLKPSDLLPEAPALAEFSTGHTMGQSAERLAKRLSISRRDQDAYALSSHGKAAKATSEGLLAADIEPAVVPPGFHPITRDNGIREGTTREKLAALPPAFDREHGSVTAGNSSFLTDGAAACLLAAEDAAAGLGLTPLARVVSASFVAGDPLEELLLGPAFAIPGALSGAGIGPGDVGVVELHEPFSAPVLAVFRLLADEGFCRTRLGLPDPLPLDPARVNAWGGSLAIGHPFGATGARLVTTCARRMEREGARWGLVASCAAGALGHALVLAR